MFAIRLASSPPSPGSDRAPVAIAGAGPAGCATAIALRRHGVPVVLFDKARFPRDKVCGDVLLPATLAALEALGLPGHDLQKQAYPCRGCRYHDGTGPPLTGWFRNRLGQPQPSWTLRRGPFDAWLLAQARAAGAVIHEGHTVTALHLPGETSPPVLEVRDPTGRLFPVASSFVVGADGASSVVARELGCLQHPPEHTCLAVRGYARGVRLPEPFLEIFTAPRLLPGCAWILPIGEDCVNVGLGVLKVTAQQAHTTPAALFREILDELPALRQRLAGAQLEDWRGWPLPGATQARAVSHGRCLLVGDAGAMIDPFTGHGIHHALMAGRLAGDAIGRSWANPDDALDPTASYAQAVTAQLRTEVRLGARLQRVHASPRWMRRLTQLARVHRGFRDLFFGLVGHADERQALLSVRHLCRASLGLPSRPSQPSSSPPSLSPVA